MPEPALQILVDHDARPSLLPGVLDSVPRGLVDLADSVAVALEHLHTGGLKEFGEEIVALQTDAHFVVADSEDYGAFLSVVLGVAREVQGGEEVGVVDATVSEGDIVDGCDERGAKSDELVQIYNILYVCMYCGNIWNSLAHLSSGRSGGPKI